MAVETYLINTADFKERADISQNMLTPKMQTFIGPTQEMFGKKILCNEFYAEVLAAQTTPTAAITTLLPYLKDYLVFKTYAQYLPNSQVNFTASGPRVQIDTTSEAATAEMMDRLIGQAESRANYYQDQLVNFLTCNEDDYPTWRDSLCGCNPKLRTEKANQFSLIATGTRQVPIDNT